jgi:hypothetical protein
MKVFRIVSCAAAATVMVALTTGCRSDSRANVSHAPTPDPTSSIAASSATVAPPYYSGGPEALPMRGDQSYATEVVSLAKKDKLNTHKPPTPVGPQGMGNRAY